VVEPLNMLEGKRHRQPGMDSIGRLFWRDGRLFRGVRAVRAELYRDLLCNGLLKQLREDGLFVDTWPTNRSTEEFPLIVEHRVIPWISYATEWSATQLRDAALTVLNLELQLRPHDLTLSDVSPWNILFDGSSSLYVDLCSITPLANKKSWPARQQFHEFFLYPLLLFRSGLSCVARRLLFDRWMGISDSELARISGRKFGRNWGFAQKARRFVKGILPSSTHGFARSVADSFCKDPSVEIANLRQKILELPTASYNTKWGNYYQENFPEFDTTERWTLKHHSVLSIFRHAKPKTVLDLGSNRGWYAQLAAREGARVVAVDNDEAALCQLYGDSKATGLPILTIFMDVRFPEPALGPAHKMLPSAGERFKSEMVLALAIVHHLVFTCHMNFQQIVDRLSIFSTKWVVVEFVGKVDAVVQRLAPDLTLFPWYNIENFVQVLESQYTVVERLPSDWGGLPNRRGSTDASDRTLIFCERKKPDLCNN
jgi:SAM-dependent methyltransferase